MLLNKGKLKLNIIFYIVFGFILLILNLSRDIAGDETWCYGFAHSIYMGLVPYRDFNMVVTPLFPFLFSLPFHIFGSSFFVFELEHIIIMLGIFYICSRVLDNNKVFILMCVVFWPCVFFVGYNSFSFFLLCLIVLLEKRNANDYLIGLVLAFSFLTKQSIGILLLLVCLYYVKKDVKKVFKRFIGFIIPNIIFLIYLISTKSLYSFLDLCFFGLFDFASKNVFEGTLFLILSICLILFSCYLLFKYKFNIIGLYCFMFLIGMVVPIFDILHFFYGFAAIVLFYLYFSKKRIFNEKILFFVILISYIFFNYNDILISFSNEFNLRHFEYKNIGLNIKYKDQLYDTNEFIKKHKDNIVILADTAYFLKISNDIPIKNTDLINYGNFGYKGSSKMIDLLKSQNDKYYLVAKENSGQTDINIINYIRNNASKVGEVFIYDIYYK